MIECLLFPENPLATEIHPFAFHLDLAYKALVFISVIKFVPCAHIVSSSDLKQITGLSSEMRRKSHIRYD